MHRSVAPYLDWVCEVHVDVDVCCDCGRGSYRVIEDNRMHVLKLKLNRFTLTPTLAHLEEFLHSRPKQGMYD